MDYEKKYKDLVEAVKMLKEENPSDEGIQNWVKDNVPELAESENERIRKELIKGISKTRPNTPFLDTNITREEALSWLEKQDTEMKDVISMDVNSETEWDDIHKFLRMNLDGEKVKLLIIREE